VEDQRDLALGLRANLEVEGYDVDVAGTGEEALRIAADRTPDVVILDIMLPGIDGYEVLAKLRAMRLAMPVLMLTARAEEVDKVRGFRTGADDYVTKPFGVMELLEAQVPGPSTPGLLRLGDVEIDVESHTVRRNGEEVSLTPKAVDLLLALHRRQGKVASRHELLRDVWGYASSVTTRTVDAHVAELRRKLEADPAEPKHILTVWKVGYRLRT
jgi:DNA-binding response OmpR family regulator